MADFLSTLAGQVLGAAPEVGPLLPPRFAPWPELPTSGALPPPPAPVESPARADATAFPPPLIAPDGPAIDAPLPTLRQMSQLRSQPGQPVEAALPPAPAGSPETTDAGQGDIRQDAAAFPPPPIAPDGPAIDAPLPTVRQMSQLRPQPRPPVEAAAPAALPGAPETTDAGQDDIRRDAAKPVGRAANDVLLSADPAPPWPPDSRQRAASLSVPRASAPAVPGTDPPSATANDAPPAAPVVQKEAGAGVSDERATVRPVPAPATEGRSAAGAIAAEFVNPRATPLSTAPASTFRSERPAELPPADPSAAGPTRPMRVQDEGAAPPQAVGDRATTAQASQPTHLPVTPTDQEASPQPPPIQSTAPGPQEAIQRHAAFLAAAREHSATAQASPTTAAAMTPLVSAPVAGPPGVPPQAPRSGSVVQRPARPGAGAAPAEGVGAPPSSTAALPAWTAPAVHPRPEPLVVPPTLVASESPVKALDQRPTTPAGGSERTSRALTSPGPATAPGPYDGPALHRQPAEARPSGDEPIVPSTTPSSPVSGRGAHAPPEGTTRIGATQPEAIAPPEVRTVPAERRAPGRAQLEAADAEGALTGWREPTILPAPEPAPEQVWSAASTTQAEAGVSARQTPARPTAGEPEPAPTVRVTIGRVVVRAAPAVERPPARPVELPRPPLSLEEYLQGRRGGGR
jgi:hypothetical protein